MSFHVGQKVVCVDDANWRNLDVPGQRPVRGQHYTVRKFHRGWDGNDPGVLLVEIKNKPHRGYAMGEKGFRARRFRPLIERSTDTGMAILRKVADDASKRKNLVNILD